MTDVTYGDLMARATRACATGLDQLTREPFSDAKEARQAIAMFADLVFALARHARHVTGAHRWSDVMQFNPEDSAMTIAAARFAAALGAVTVHNRPRWSRPPDEGGLSAHLRTATIAVRAATDLLETHQGADGRWRAPESPILSDLSTRVSALGNIATMAIRLADERPTLLNRAHASGVTFRRERTRPPPELAAVRDTARDFHALVAAETSPASGITNLVAARSDVRRTETVVELQDRLSRMRVTAWRNAMYPDSDGGISGLITFATTAVTVHGTAALIASRQAGPDRERPLSPQMMKTILTRAELWRRIRSELLLLDSASWQDTTLDEDGRAIRRLLADLTPQPTRSPKGQPRHPALDEGLGEVALLDGAQTQVPVVLSRAVAIFEEIAGWNSSTLQSLDAEEQVSVPNWVIAGPLSQHLTARTMRDHPDLLTGDLERALVPASRQSIRDLVKAYGTVSFGLSLGPPVPEALSPTSPGFEAPGL